MDKRRAALVKLGEKVRCPLRFQATGSVNDQQEENPPLAGVLEICGFSQWLEGIPLLFSEQELEMQMSCNAEDDGFRQWRLVPYPVWWVYLPRYWCRCKSNVEISEPRTQFILHISSINYTILTYTGISRNTTARVIRRRAYWFVFLGASGVAQ